MAKVSKNVLSSRASALNLEEIYNKFIDRSTTLNVFFTLVLVVSLHLVLKSATSLQLYGKMVRWFTKFFQNQTEQTYHICVRIIRIRQITPCNKNLLWSKTRMKNYNKSTKQFHTFPSLKLFVLSLDRCKLLFSLPNLLLTPAPVSCKVSERNTDMAKYWYQKLYEN